MSFIFLNVCALDWLYIFVSSFYLLPVKRNSGQYVYLFLSPISALKDQFAGYIDGNGDEKATKEEILGYLKHYKPSISEKEVAEFISRRDKDGRFCVKLHLYTIYLMLQNENSIIDVIGD